MSLSLRIAVVGAGPAGMYTLQHLLNKRDLKVEIDLYERLPVPWGLVRYGVAPDHTEKKRVADLLFSYFLGHPKVHFFGNVEIGKDIRHKDLAEWYDAVIYAVGADSDIPLGVPGENLDGCWAAREFVAWYNGHPDYSDLKFDLSSQRAVIIGNGNVALDVARILTMSAEELAKTDIADYALQALSTSKIEEVVILGRRSPSQGAFNNAELEELEHLDGVKVSIQADDFPVPDDELSDIGWQARRKLKTLERLVTRKPPNVRKRISFQFLSSPIELAGKTKVEQLVVARNQLIPDEHGNLTAQTTNEKSTINAGLVLRAIGYRGNPFPGLPFDQNRNVIKNECGRILDQHGSVTGAYVTGWIKRGPRGIIGTNKQCAKETVACLLSDLSTGNLKQGSALSLGAVEEQLKKRNIKTVSEKAWRKIDHHEQMRGQTEARPRVKLNKVDEMLSIAKE